MQTQAWCKIRRLLVQKQVKSQVISEKAKVQIRENPKAGSKLGRQPESGQWYRQGQSRGKVSENTENKSDQESKMQGQGKNRYKPGNRILTTGPSETKNSQRLNQTVGLKYSRAGTIYAGQVW